MFDNMLALEQRQMLSVKQVQSLEILAYTNQELEDFLLNEYLENPMLENALDKQNDMMKDLEQIYEKGLSYKEHCIQWEEDDDNRRGDIRAKNPDEMKDFLLSQLNRKDYDETEWKLMGYLIQCLDVKGFFTYEVSEIANVLGYQEHTVNKYLEILKGLEPVGIFARDISECLQKQLKNRGMNDEKLNLIVDKYLTDILAGHIGVVSRDLKLTTAKVKEYIHLIGTLNPRPIMNIQSDTVQYIVPDILVSLEKGSWLIRLNDQWMGEYKYNEYYMRMMQESQDDSIKEYFKVKLERARFIINCVEQRRNTIIKIVEAILGVQEKYFKNDKELKPMTMEDIARMTDMHVSTVSRAIRDKYVQYKKTVQLKDLFVSAVQSQEELSVDIIKRRIQEIIRGESSSDPLSDQSIAHQIQEEGVDISRRAVSKYRKQMGIPDSRQRLYL